MLLLNLDKLKFSRGLLIVFTVLLILGQGNAAAEDVKCMDDQDCQNGKVCTNQGTDLQGVCDKRCDPLRMNLVFDSTEHYTSPSGNYVRYRIKVKNWSQYTDDMFASAPNLPPCGINNNSSRTWVFIYDADTDSGIYSFCDLRKAESLTELWFAVVEGKEPPEKVYVIMEDRKTGKKYCSNEVRIVMVGKE